MKSFKLFIEEFVESKVSIGKFHRRLNTIGLVVCFIPAICSFFIALVILGMTIGLLLLMTGFSFLVSLFFGSDIPKAKYVPCTDTKEEENEYEENGIEDDIEEDLEEPVEPEIVIETSPCTVDTKPGSYTSDH